MNYICKLILAYDIIIPIAVCLLPIISNDIMSIENNEGNTINDSNNHKLKIFIEVISMLFLLVIVLYLAVIKRFLVPLLFISALTYLQRTNEALFSISFLNMSLKRSTEAELSIKERFSVMIIALFITIFHIYDIPIKLINKLNQIPNEMLSDLLTIVAMVIVISVIYFFLILVVFFFIIEVLKRIVGLVNKYDFHRIKKLINATVDNKKKLRVFSFLSLKILKSTNYGILKVFLVILAVIIDIILVVILML